MTYAEPTEALPSMFKDWSNISLVQDTTGPHSLPELVDILSEGTPDSVRETYWDVTFKLDRSLSSFFLLTIPQLQQMQKNGGNALCISPADSPMFIMDLESMWTSPIDDNRISRFNNDTINRVQAEAAKKGLNNDYIYMNYASSYQSVISSYGAGNQKRLNSVAQFFDPSRFLKELQPVCFKLSGGAPLGSYT
ncbi:hypothetical protein E8E12_000208 [Didymella heteroderae]|uniref:Berberine/berberine-like domain-containing protein n=1 Tax=Didymella heteroderae TaxID=1769908 RepID=A0A9P5BU65_9PLEO|nr:hypothetical protein E8E12_000208 [Didymella heteroderae]